MKIRSISPNEPEGRTVDIDGIVYHFKPDADGNNLCEVTEKAHVTRFLSIPEGYEVFDPSLKETVKKPAPKAEAPAPAKTATNPDPLAGTTEVHEVTDEDVEEAGPEGATPAPTEEALPAPKPKKGKDYNGLTRKQLVAAYTKKFGRAPHPNAKDATIVAALAED